MNELILNKIKPVFSTKKADAVIIILAFLVRGLQLFYFYNIRVDGLYQIMVMENFTEGHGLSISTVLPSDIASDIYTPLFNWPPGYSFLLAPFYIIFKHNYITAGLFVEFISAFFQILISRKILAVLKTEKYLINIFTIFSAFFLYGFYTIDSSDAITTTFFLVAILCSLKILETKKGSLFNISAIIISLFMCSMLKYLFFPVIFSIPLIFLLKHWKEKKQISKPGFIITLSLLFLIGSFLLYQKLISGSVGYISSPGRGFFPENLKETWPAIPASFMNPETPGLIFPEYKNFAFNTWRLIYIFSIIYMVYFFIRNILFNKNFINPLQKSFIAITCLTSAAIITSLTLLSLTISKEEILPGMPWTYVQEPRYYGVITVLIQLLFFSTVLPALPLQKNSIKIFIVTGFVFIFIETARGVIFIKNRIKNINKEEYSWQYELKIQKFADKIIQNIKAKNPDTPVVITGSAYYYYLRTGIYSHISNLTDVESINEFSKISTSRPVILLVMLEKKSFSTFAPFLENRNIEFVGSYKDFYFYSAYVAPAKQK